MAQLVIRIDTDNAAFTDNPDEITHVLSQVSADIKTLFGDSLAEDDKGAGCMRDSNGNTVGEWYL